MNTTTPPPAEPQTAYVYLGDRFTCGRLKQQHCTAVRSKSGKCVRGKNGAMLVHFEGAGPQVVIGRRLRKTAVKSL